MTSILPFDEMNNFTLKLRGMFPNGNLPQREEAIEEKEDIIDEMLDLFLLAYATGNSVTNANLDYNWTPTVTDATGVVNKEIAGKTWKDRVEDYFTDGGTVDDLIRIVETETHRDANTAALDTAKRAGATQKTWVTMADERVRDTHQYLEMMTVDIDEDFYTYDGDHASAPGLFSLPENNINCRCELVFS